MLLIRYLVVEWDSGILDDGIMDTREEQGIILPR
jgi:hypothetical protein